MSPMGTRCLASPPARPPYLGPDSWELAEPPAELQTVLKVLAQVTQVHHRLLWRLRGEGLGAAL